MTPAAVVAPPDPLEALDAFARALRAETSVIVERPELLWQQLYNRLQWDGPVVRDLLAEERARRSRPGARLWIHDRTGPRPVDSLVKSIGGNHGFLADCAVSPDATWIVSASFGLGEQGTLKIWDAATGTELATIPGYGGSQHGIAVSPDGSRIVFAAEDNSLMIWDRATGSERATLRGHTGDVHACAISPAAPGPPWWATQAPCGAAR